MSDESVRELERAAEAGTLDPVRALAELDRRGLLSRGREVVARAKRFEPFLSAEIEARNLSRSVGRGLGRTILDARERDTFRAGFLDGYIYCGATLGDGLRGESSMQLYVRAELECDAWMFGQGPRQGQATMQAWLARTRGFSLPSRATRGVPMFQSAFHLLEQIGDCIEPVIFMNRGSGVMQRLDPDTITVQIGKPRLPREQRLAAARAERARKAREKTRANVNRKPPRTL